MTSIGKISLAAACALAAAASVSCTRVNSLASDKSLDAIVKPVVDTMSLRHKVSQLFYLDIYPGGDSIRHAKDDSIIVKEQVGGIIFMEGNIEEVASSINSLQAKMDIPLGVSVDGEWGLGMRVSEFKKFPRQAFLAKLPSEKYLYEVGQAMAAEMRSMKVDINFAPVIDVNLHPDVNTINTRSFGPDKKLVAKYGSAIARGMQNEGVVACAKHFPGHGDTEVDSHKALPVLNFPMDRIEDIELYPFRKLIADGVDMVMVGHLSVPVLDTLPASVSYNVITRLLRQQMGFNGLIITDALNMRGVLDMYDSSYPKATLAAYQAGADILLMPHDVTECIDAILEYIGSDPVKLADLDARLTRVLKIKARSGALSPGYDPMIAASEVDSLMSRPILDRLASMIEVE